MAAMKSLYTVLKEAQDIMRETDPLSFEAAVELVEREMEFCPCCGDIIEEDHEC